MTNFQSQIHLPDVLKHDLNQHFPYLLQFESIDDAKKSDVYVKIKPTVDRILSAVVCENFSPLIETNAQTFDLDSKPLHAEEGNKLDVQLSERSHAAEISVVAWNIERGRMFEGILETLKTHDKLKEKDIYLLTELDYGMIRSGNRFVAQEIAGELKLNYAFAPVYIALQKGSGIESALEGENTLSIHGLAMFSKFPLKNVHAVDLPNGKDKMRGKEKRLGYLRALIADVEHSAGNFRAVTIHLDAHSSRKHRENQVRIVLDHLEKFPKLPTIFGGDFNTISYDAQSATHSILSLWHRALRAKDVCENQFPHPDRRFEKGLFDQFTKFGFEYEKFNELGKGTLHYDIDNISHNANLGDWVPAWCFPFIFWAAKKAGGKFSMRLDWFFGRGIDIVKTSAPQTVGKLIDSQGAPLSDHDAISLDFVLKNSQI